MSSSSDNSNTYRVFHTDIEHKNKLDNVSDSICKGLKFQT